MSVSRLNGVQLFACDMEEIEKNIYYQKRHQVTGFKYMYVRFLHDIAPTHTSAIVTIVLEKQKLLKLQTF